MPCIPHKKRIFAITSKKNGCAPTQTLPGEYFPNWHSKVKKVKVKFVFYVNSCIHIGTNKILKYT